MGDTGFEALQKSPMKNTSSLSLGAESGAFFARIDFGTFHTLRAGVLDSRPEASHASQALQEAPASPSPCDDPLAPPKCARELPAARR